MIFNFYFLLFYALLKDLTIFFALSFNLLVQSQTICNWLLMASFVKEIAYLDTHYCEL